MTSKQRYSWGRYPPLEQSVHAIYWRDQLAPELEKFKRQHNTLLPYGNGRSYGDSCLAASDQLLQMRGLNRMIDADWNAGFLIAEAGTTLEEILRVSVPRGWFLPVTPGTKFVTLGGAVANDVHGKNHHVRGTFGLHVRRFGLLRSDRGLLECSAQENSELFGATIGGLGLTGVIAWVELQLLPIQSSQVETCNWRFENLDEFFDLSDAHDSANEYSVAWVDCLASGGSLGRGHFTVGNHAQDGKFDSPARKKMVVPLVPPFSLVNAASLRIFNFAYYHRQRERARRALTGYDSFFYPLDAIAHWNRLYGPRGFQQYQCVIPNEHARAAMPALLRAIAAENAGSFLAVLKRCGDKPSPGLLSFPLPGVSLALDFPQRDTINSKLFAHLDAIVRECGGRLYPAKDAHMSGTDFRTAYPAWNKVEALRDPILMSRFWQRVTQNQ